MKSTRPATPAERDLLKSAREIMADARCQMRDCSTWMHETIEITFTDAANVRVRKPQAPQPSATGWECPKCARVYAPTVTGCAACNEEPPECVK